MKTYTSSRKRDAACAVSFGRRFCSAVILVLIAFCAVCLSSCTKPDEEQPIVCFDVPPIQSDSKLIGTWESSYGEVYEISGAEFKNGGSWGESYAGRDLYVSEFEGGYGYIYFIYTKSLDENYVCSETAPDVGKWYCVAYKNLSDSGVSFSGAYKDGGKTSVESLEEAAKEFTIENGYFGMYSECVKK